MDTAINVAAETRSVTVTKYTYDADGIRTEKVINGVTHHYVTRGGKLMRESFLTSTGEVIMDFSYDESGRPFAVSYSRDGGANFTTYYYATNLQGDVVMIFGRTAVTDEDGNTTYAVRSQGYYTYDAAGNILTKSKDGTVTKTYAYGNSQWKDLLTSVNGQTITYDANGNPLQYRTGTVDRQGNAEVYYMNWENGRQLAYVDTDDGQWRSQISYTYDANGIRTGKDIDGETHTYVTQNGKVVRETIGSGSSATVLDFIYDNQGQPFALKYSTNGGASFDTYYYILNLQGDVVKLISYIPGFEYAEVANYTYDAWGNILTATGSKASINPLRYRGYYYDTETRFYYLQSRYYDPATHRFINADAYASTDIDSALASNMFSYCGNNPVSRVDPYGTSWGDIWDDFIEFLGGIFGASSSTITSLKFEKEIMPDPMPITWKNGVQVSETISSYGDSSKPVSVYANCVANNKILSSSAGVKVNIGSYTANLNVALDDVSLMSSIRYENTSYSIAVKVNLSELKIGLESAVTQNIENKMEKQYTNVSVNGWFLAALAYALVTGNPMPSPLQIYN